MKSLKQIYESGNPAGSNPTRAEKGSAGDEDELAVPEPVGRAGLALSDDALEYIEQADNYREAVRAFISLEKNVAPMLSAALKATGFDRKTSELVASAFVVEYFRKS